MLSEEEKNRIRLEEIFREEVRSSLNNSKPKTFQQKTLAFLNSALGIWLLSSVALSLVSWSYSRLSESVEEERENKATIQKLDIEISARIRKFEAFLQTDSSNVMYFINLLSLDNPSTIDKMAPVVFPEYSRRGMRSLLWELYSRVPENEKGAVTRALDVAEKLSLRGAEAIKFIDGPSADENAEANPADIEETRNMLKEAFSLPRWSGMN